MEYYLPPNIRPFAECRGLDHLRGHPGVGARRGDLGGVVHFPRQSEVGYFQSFVQ